MKMLSAVTRILFVATAVVTAALLFPSGNVAMGQDDDNVFCIGNRCVDTDAFHRCDFAPDPCGCLFCEVGMETCCHNKEVDQGRS